MLTTYRSATPSRALHEERFIPGPPKPSTHMAQPPRRRRAKRNCHRSGVWQIPQDKPPMQTASTRHARASAQ